ncbi:MAG: glucosaminidase domain-containing protein [Acidimicrobiia bacterium]|nr:glucosaminidase domain-containing protein [Acidimicrobiia bacterium]
MIALYLSESDAEGVRGDYALAQAILETGYFANTDTSINNFAGIAHYDGTSSGVTFPDAATGVHAHIQLLKKFAAGNDAPLAYTDVSPNAGASATTWGGLAGTWASSTEYWTSLHGLYQAMTDTAGGARQATATGPAQGCARRHTGDQRRLHATPSNAAGMNNTPMVHQTPPRLPRRRHPIPPAPPSTPSQEASSHQRR